MHPVQTDVVFIPRDGHDDARLDNGVVADMKPSLTAKISDLHRDRVLQTICKKISDLCKQKHTDTHICALFHYTPRGKHDNKVTAIVSYTQQCMGSHEDLNVFLIAAQTIMSPGRRRRIIREATRC
jgi:hypothetical protein